MPIEYDTACCSDLHRRDEFTGPGAERHYPPDLVLEPTHLDIALWVDVPGKRALGVVTATVRANGPDATTLRLDAVDFEAVVVESPDGVALTHTYDGTKLIVHWPAPIPKGESQQLRIRYRVVEPVAGMHFSAPDAAYPDRPEFCATDHETERARYWLPCVDLPNVRTTLDFHLRTAAKYTVLASGSLTGEETHDDGSKTVHYKLDFPCPSYLTCFAIGDFVAYEDEPFEGRPVAYYTTQQFSADDLKRSFGRTPAMLAWLTGKLGRPFPFPKYFQFALPNFGGAMENISLVSWDAVFVLDAVAAREWTLLVDEINIHEMAHSFFGDAVVCRDFGHAWLKESWATYIEHCYFEDVHGKDEGDYVLYNNSRAYRDEADNRYVRPIVTRKFDSSWSMYDRHLYPGGAWRLHMLRRLLTDEVFWPAISDYLATYEGKVVETADFVRVLETHSGRSLWPFFDQWIYGRGYPKLKLGFSHDKKRGLGTFTIEQTQVDDKKGIAAFTFPLTLAWEDAEGTWRRTTTEIATAKQQVVVSMPAAPQQFRIDPDNALLHGLEFTPGEAALTRQLSDGPDIVARIQAGQALAKSGRRAAFAALDQAYRKEPFFGVRVELARAVAEAKSRLAIPLLAAWLKFETNDRALAAVARAAGTYRDPALGEALEGFLKRDLPHFARAAALDALGRQRDPRHAETLRAHTDDDSWQHVVRAGALAALGHTRTLEAFRFLLSRVGYGADSDRARIGAIGALAAAAVWQERPRQKEAVERLIELTRDPIERVRLAAGRQLPAVEAGGAGAAALTALKSTIAVQSAPGIDRLIRKLRAHDPAGGTAALKGQIEKLTEKQQRLEERLQALEAQHEPTADGDPGTSGAVPEPPAPSTPEPAAPPAD